MDSEINSPVHGNNFVDGIKCNGHMLFEVTNETHL